MTAHWHDLMERCAATQRLTPADAAEAEAVQVSRLRPRVGPPVLPVSEAEEAAHRAAGPRTCKAGCGRLLPVYERGPFCSRTCASDFYCEDFHD